MKTKLLKKLRKRFDWKFILKDNIKMMVVYDKELHCIHKNFYVPYLGITDLEYLLDIFEFEDEKLMKQYRNKKTKLKFDKL